jgi:hypothetical protein
MLTGHERTDQVIGRLVRGLDVRFRVVALVEDQRDVLLQARQQLPMAACQGGQDLGEGDAVRLIARMDLPEQGDVEVGRNHQGQTDDAQVGAVAFGVTALGQTSRRLRIDVGVEVGGIIEERLQVEAVVFDQAAAEGFFDALQDSGIEVIEVVPEALAGQVLDGDGEQAWQDGALIPVRQACLGTGTQGAAESGKQQVVGYGVTLSPFGGVLLEQGMEVEILGDFPERRDGAKVTDQGSIGLVHLLKAKEQVVGLAEVGEDDRARLAVDASGFDDLPVGMAMNGLGSQTRHRI